VGISREAGRFGRRADVEAVVRGDWPVGSEEKIFYLASQRGEKAGNDDERWETRRGNRRGIHRRGAMKNWRMKLRLRTAHSQEWPCRQCRRADIFLAPAIWECKARLFSAAEVALF